MEVIKIPKGVKTILGEGYFFGDSLTDIYLPASVEKIETHGLSARSMVNYHVAKKNKHYADIDGSVYSKKSGRLVAASVKESTYTVPDTVTKLKNTCFAGPDVEKFIIPSSVEEIARFWCPFRENITYVFQDETSPVIDEDFADEDITFYVPMGCKEQYKNAVDQSWILNNINIPGIERGLINIIEY